jgi:hypothetical protein
LKSLAERAEKEKKGMKEKGKGKTTISRPDKSGLEMTGSDRILHGWERRNLPQSPLTKGESYE